MGQRIVQNNNNSQLVNGRVALALLGLSKRASANKRRLLWAAGKLVIVSKVPQIFVSFLRSEEEEVEAVNTHPSSFWLRL